MLQLRHCLLPRTSGQLGPSSSTRLGANRNVSIGLLNGRSLGTATAATAVHSDSFMPHGKTTELADEKALSLIKRLSRVPVTVPDVRADGLPIMTAVAGPSSEEMADYARTAPAIIMLHSFDSSCLEFRRLHPLLLEYLPTYAVDLVGWGFTDHTWLKENNSVVLGPKSKREHLRAFIEQHLNGRPVVLLGASVGGAIAMDFALHYPDAVRQLVLVDPQVFIDGIGPMAQLPRPVAEIGVKLLQTEWIRDQANQMAYYDKAGYATKEATRVGRLHTFLPGWMEANIAFMRSGGYSVSHRIKEVTVPTLVLWGRNDEILDAKFAEKFPQELPESRVVFVERCGHSPHLEQAGIVGGIILDSVLPLLEEGIPPSGEDSDELRKEELVLSSLI